jgi:predicted permease
MKALLDLRHSLRTLRKDPAYAAAVILLLALGIGANTAIFSVANSVLSRPLPYAHPEQLVVALHGGNAPVSPADYMDYKHGVHAFERMEAAQVWGGAITMGGRPEQIPGLSVTANMMDLLGVPPMLGRSFTSEEEHAGKSAVLLLSYSLWQNHFGGDKTIIGRQVFVDRIPYTVVGVMPPESHFAPFWSTRAQMWSPLVLDDRLHDNKLARGGRSLRVFARLRPGVTVAQAQSQMDAVAKRLEELYPETNAKLGITVVPLLEKVVRSVRPTLLVLLGAVGFVLLIACATVGNLMLARAVARRKEMALRLAVGAQRADLIRIAFTEAFLLAIGAGVGAILLSNWAVAFLGVMLPPGSIPRQVEIGFDWVALLFAGAITLLSAVLAGIVPGLQAMRVDLNTDLKEGGRGSTHAAGRIGTRSALVAVEVGLSLVLMAGAGLMMRTMLALQAVDAGFDPHNLVTMQVAVSGTDYDQYGRRAGLFREVRDRLATIPGVESVGAINHLPLGGDIWNIDYTIVGHPIPPPGDEMSAVYRVVMPGYFHTMLIGMLGGRDFNAHDNEKAPAVAIINEAMAKRRWPGEDPVGKVIRYGVGPDDRSQPRIIVGVVRSARQDDWTAAPDDEIYLPYYQRPDSMGLSYLTFVLRTGGNPNAIADAAVRTVGAFEKSLPVSEVATMERIVADELWRQRLAAILIGTFAGVALLLAAAGIYSVISYSMRQRTQEIGIRMALGADGRDLVRLVLWKGMKPVLLGVVAGLISALSLTRFLKTLLYGVTATDTATLAGVLIVLIAVCVFANLIPALRATRVDPLIALRHE